MYKLLAVIIAVIGLQGCDYFKSKGEERKDAEAGDEGFREESDEINDEDKAQSNMEVADKRDENIRRH